MIAKLIVLDWRASITAYKIAYLFYPLMIFIVGLATSQILVVPLSVWIALSYSTNPFYSEERGELNNLFLTLPVKRQQIVIARFTFSLIMMLVGIAVGIAIMPVVRHFSNSMWWLSVESNIGIIAVSVLLFALFNLFVFPTLFKLGYQKGRVWGIYLPAAIFFGIISGYNTIMLVVDRNITFEFLIFAGENMMLVSGGLVVLAAIILLVSYRLSLRFYLRRDF